MFYRKNAVLAAVAGILASAGFAFADGAATQPSSLSLTPTTACTPADGSSSGLLMQGLDKIGAADPLKKADINIYGWLEGGYTYSFRHGNTVAPLLPGPFNHEFGGGSFPYFSGGSRNHFMLNQLALRFEREVKSDQWDVGGMVELMYGTDSNAIHANGLSLGNETYSGKGGSDILVYNNFADDRFNPQYQLDIVQAYVDVNVPVGNGLKLRAGKFVSLMGYEAIDPRNNPFYSHSYLFAVMPSTFTGVVGFYKINDQWAVAGGISRGWDQCLEDNNGAINVIGQVSYTPDKQWSALLNFVSGPENDRDNSHYRTTIDGVLTWRATRDLKFGLEGLYVYDGGRNGYIVPPMVSLTHAYGDQWGGYLYSAYDINSYVTANARLGFFHNYVTNFVDNTLVTQTISLLSGGGLINGMSVPTVNVWDITLGVTVRPFPKDPIGKNLIVRPEVRYSFSEDPIYVESNGRTFKNQLTFGADVVFSF
ncbi:MAG: porin [Phycisphaerales bacterium]|nr:porin [Phycisphaerales bacterium]